jgi:hypothetical protein
MQLTKNATNSIDKLSTLAKSYEFFWKTGVDARIHVRQRSETTGLMQHPV